MRLIFILMIQFTNEIKENDIEIEFLDKKKTYFQNQGICRFFDQSICFFEDNVNQHSNLNIFKTFFIKSTKMF